MLNQVNCSSINCITLIYLNYNNIGLKSRVFANDLG